MLAFVDLEERVPPHHPLRAIKRFAERALGELSPTFDAMYGRGGRPSIPPERLLKASLLISLYSVRSERAFCEELNYQLLWRWFLDMTLMEPSFDQSTFSKNRARLLGHVVALQFFDAVVRQADALGLLSDEHFTVDGTLIEAWASQKSFQRKDGGPDDDGRNFHGESRKNDTHASKTDPDARLYRKSRTAEARLAYLGHLLIENRHGLIVDAMATHADGTAERDAAMLMLHEQTQATPGRRRTLGGDKNYDTRAFVEVMRALQVTPHVTQNIDRSGGSAIDARTTRHVGYGMSQACRPRIEPVFGWMKTIAWLRKIKLRGLPKVDWLVVFACAAFNLLRLPKLLAEATA
jgi:transposase